MSGGYSSIKQMDGKIRTSSMPYLYDIAEGNFADHAPIRRFGYNGTVAAAWETISAVSALHTYLSSAEKLKITSTDNNDANGDAGANSIILKGLDANYEVIEETIEMNGQNAVTTTNAFLRPLQSFVETAGSSTTNEGTITIKNNAATTTLLQINPMRGNSMAAIWTVPANTNAYLSFWYGSESSSKGSEIGLFIRPFGKAFRQYRAMTVFDSNFGLPFTLPLKITQKSDIELRAKGVLAGAIVSGGFIGWYEE